jgi:hypothetical protein
MFHTLSKLIIEKAQSKSGPWSYSFYCYLRQSLVKIKKNDAEKLIHVLIQKILENENELLTFKLCQICSDVKARKLSAFEGVFDKYSKDIERFITENKSSFFRDAIDGLMHHLLLKISENYE